MVAVDISYAQGYPNYDALASNISLVIAKAASAEGGSLYTDSKLSYNRDGVRGAGRQFGTYFFNGPVDPNSSAEYYVSVIDYRAGDLVALDVESPDAWNVDQVIAFHQRVQQLIGVIPATYGSSSLLFGSEWKRVSDMGSPLWVANYGANNGSPNRDPGNGPWAHRILWQYTSTAHHSGLTGNIDTNLVNDAELAAYLGNHGSASNDGDINLDELRQALHESFDPIRGMLQNISGSPEQLQEYTSQINAQYQDVLGRDADPVGLNGFLSAMVGGASLDQVRRALINSDEYNSRYVQNLYRDLLGRDGAQEELNGWVSFFHNSGNSWDSVSNAIKGSVEYKQKH